MIYKRIGDYKIGFKYYYENNKEILNNKIIEYIKSIKIAPCYNNVIINSNKNDKILAYGYDSKNRKQVIYNPKFIEEQSKTKFKKYMKIKKYIKRIKNKTNKDILQNENIKNKEIAIIIYLILYCNFRIGNEKYLKENNSYGLTTLEYKHLNFKDNDKIEIEFIGKKGVLNKSICKNKEIYNYLFLNKDKRNKVFNYNSIDVNNYLKEICPNITCKDLRTLNANELFIKYMKNNKISTSIKLVSEQLHNTPAVCKKNYIDPILIEKYNN